MKKCEYCRKTLIEGKQKRFCSNRCKNIVNGKIFGKIGAHNAQKTLKKLKLGFYNPETGRSGGKKAAITNKRNKTSMFFDKKIQRKAGLNSQHTLRVNIRNLKFKGQYYDSHFEINISINLQEQFKYIPKERKTLHMQIGKYEYDFLIESLKLFVEPHQWFKNETEEEYYSKRRKNLDKNGYKNYDLIVIK